jgi:hypothetical protein
MQTSTQSSAQSFTSIQPGIYTSLNQLIESLLQTHRSVAIQNKSLVVNNIPKDLLINTERDMLTSLISSILATVVHYTKGSCISISAKVYHDIILLNIKDNSLINNEAVISSLNRLQPVAEQLGGNISINIAPGQTASVILSFISGGKTILQQL